MKTDKAKQLVRLYNRLGVLQQSLWGEYRSDRNREVAAQYNTLRKDVKRFVNDPDFDRVVPRAWCFKPFLHIPLAFLVLSLGLGLAYFLLESDQFWVVLMLAFLLVVGAGIAINAFPASTVRQVENRADMLHSYLQDYINLNPALGLRIGPKDEQRLERQLEDLRSCNLELEEELEEMEHELEHLKEELAELRRRESTYLSIIKEAQTSATYSPSLKDREILLESYRRQWTILIKNLTRYQEDKAKYGLNVPVHIQNAIDQTQEDLERIEAQIAHLKADKTQTN